MEFEGQYLTYEEYKSLGGNLDSPSFDLLEFHARNQIDSMTFNRLVNINTDDIPQKVKICDFDLVERLNGYRTALTKISESSNLSGFNSDGYSESYVSPTQVREIVASKQSEIEDIISSSLFGVAVNGEHILYCGVN